MNQKIICSCGYAFTPATDETEPVPVCPECGKQVDLSVAPKPSPKGLWAVMQNESEQTDPDSEEQEFTNQSENSPQEASENISEENDRPRGLWSVMQPGETSEEQDSDQEPVESTYGLTSQATSAQERQLSEPEAQAVEADGPESNEHENSGLDPLGNPLATPAEISSTSQNLDAEWATQRYVEEKSGRSVNAVLGFLLGLAAVPLSAFGILDAFWAKLPGTVIGLLALILGMLASGEIRAARGKLKGAFLSRLAMVLGIAGMFLAPVVFGPLGAELRFRSGRGKPMVNLTQIGQAFDQYEAAYNRYPSGGTYSIDADGSEMPMHSWMTALLPYLSQEPLHRSIDINQPFDAPDNADSMKHVVPVFLSSGLTETRSDREFGLAHFAGVGGELVDPMRGILPMGILGRNSAVVRANLADGRSQTLVAGEVANAFSEWGDPDNLRRVTGGINADYHGFGNADGTGAAFLFADGSVRYFSNETSPEILLNLSTRNGEEPVPGDFR